MNAEKYFDRIKKELTHVSPFYSDTVLCNLDGRDVRIKFDLPETGFRDVYAVVKCDLWHIDDAEISVVDLTDSDMNGNGLDEDECHCMTLNSSMEEGLEKRVQDIIPYLKDMEKEFNNEHGIK